MNELEKALAQLKEMGATPQELDEYTREFMSSRAAPADASMALQRERPNPTGDWEAIPEGLKTAAGVGVSMYPMGRVFGAAERAAPVAGAFIKEFAKDLPVISGIFKGAKAAGRVRKVATAVKSAPKPSPAASKGLPQLDDILVEATETAAKPAARTLEEAVGLAKPAAKAWKPRSAPKARFDMIAKRQAEMATKEVAEVAEPSLEDLLALSLEHIKKGGSMKSASDALKLVRQK
jgi:hypothetical protein